MADSSSASLLPSGPAWVRKFPTSRSTRDLIAPFRENVDRFIRTLEAAGVTVLIEATLRPPARAHLMHYAFRIAREDLDPCAVPEHPGIAIDWQHRDAGGRPNGAAAFAAAQAMVEAYDIVYRPALSSVHCEGRAIDLTLTWPGDILVTDGMGQSVPVTGPPRNCNHPTVHHIGATYGVLKLVRDTPHWSDNGK